MFTAFLFLLRVDGNGGRRDHSGRGEFMQRASLLKPSGRRERGTAMLLVVMIVAMMAFIFIGSQMIQNSASNSKFQLNVTVQADNVARAGLTDAINWFRNQVTQPVRSTANPALYPYPDAAFAPIAS